MAAYPPGPSRLFQLPDLAGGQAPGDLAYLVDVSLGTNAGDPSDVKSTLDDLFAEITKNVAEKTVAWSDSDGVRTVSAVNTGKLAYSVTNQSFQVSENGGAYQNLVKGVGANTRVAFWTAADELSSDSAFLWDSVDDRLLINVSVANGEAPIDVQADALASAQQWRENAGAAKVLMQVPSSFGQLGTVGAHDFALVTNSLQRVNVESGGAAVFGSIVPATGQVMINALTVNTVGLVVNNFAATNVDLARFQINSSNRFVFTKDAEMVAGLAATIDGKITLASAGAAFTQSLMAGTAPAATNAFRWPNANPTAGQALTASAPAAGVVTLSWTSITTAPAAPTGSVQFNGGGVFDGDSNLLWDDTPKQLLVGGIALAAGEAPIDVKADVTASAQQWRENAGAAKVLMQVPSSFGQLGTVGAHDFALVTNSLQRLNIESGGAAVFGSIVPATAQVMINALTVNTVGLVVNNFAATNVDLARLQINSSNRFIFTKDAEMVTGLASTVDGKITLASAGAAFTQSLMAGTAPAATNSFRWPNADPTLGQALTASAPAAGVVTLSWTTISGGATINPTDTVMPYRFDATTFQDSNLIRLSTTVTDLRDITTGTNAQSFRVYGTSDNGAADPTNYVRGVFSTTTAQVVIAAQSGGTGSANLNIAFAPIGTGGLRFNGAASRVQVFTDPGTDDTTADVMWSQSSNTGRKALVINANGASATNTVEILNSANTSGFGFRTGNGILMTIGVSGNTKFNFNAGTPVQQYSSDVVVGWTTTVSGAGARDIELSRLTTSTLRIGNGAAVANCLIGSSTDSVTGNFTVMSSNAATNTVVTVARLGVNSTGTAADGLGAALSFSAETSTTNDTETARINAFWTTATHAIRASALSFSIVTGGTVTDAARLAVAGLGSPFTLSVYDGTAPNVWTAGAFAAKLYLISPTLPAVGVAAHFSATGLDAPQWQMLRGRGTNASPTAIQSGDSIGNIEWWGQTSTATNNVVAGARIRVSATENWSAGNNGCDMYFFVSNNAGTITERMSLVRTGTLRVGATAGSFSTDTKLQVGGFSSWNTDVAAAIYSGADAVKGLELIGTASQSAAMLRVFRTSVTPDLLTVAGSGLVSVRAGQNTGTTQANVGGTLDVNTTSVPNSSTTETDLMTYSVVANTLGTNGDFIRVEAAGSFEASGNNKQLRAYLGATLLFDTGALAFAPSTAVSWRLVVTIYRTGASAQGSVAEFACGGAVLISTVQQAGGTEDLTTNLTFKLTGQGGASDEIFQDLMIVEWNPNA